jgi:hypothetical protein
MPPFGSNGFRTQEPRGLYLQSRRLPRTGKAGRTFFLRPSSELSPYVVKVHLRTRTCGTRHETVMAGVHHPTSKTGPSTGGRPPLDRSDRRCWSECQCREWSGKVETRRSRTRAGRSPFSFFLCLPKLDGGLALATLEPGRCRAGPRRWRSRLGGRGGVMQLIAGPTGRRGRTSCAARPLESHQRRGMGDAWSPTGHVRSAFRRAITVQADRKIADFI